MNNYFILEASYGKLLSNGSGNYINKSGFNIFYSAGKTTPIDIYQSDSLLVIIIGHPSFTRVIDNDEFIKQYLQLKSDSKLSSIDGEFLIIECNLINKTISTINSRFGTPVVFYATFDNRMVVSTAYQILYSFLIRNRLSKINTDACYDLLRFKRIFNQDTYDTNSKYLSPGSILNWNGKLSLSKYWTPSYSKNNLSLNENASNLLELVKQSISYKTSDDKNYGIMQSGGLDTRLILSNFTNPPHAFTITYTKNREYEIAKQLVDFKGGDHSWIKVKNGQYNTNFDHASSVTSAMYMADCLFYGHQKIIQDKSNVLFSGYGMDYFFQGMYLPAKMYSVFGEDIPWFKTLDMIQGNFVEYFINNISYNVKGLDVSNILSSKQSSRMNDRIFHAVSCQLSDAKEYASDPYDIWEYMSLGDLSRHYTYGGQLSLMELSELRNVSYTNSMLDLYHSIPYEQRFDARVLRKSLKKVDKRFYHLPSANHGYPAGYSSMQRSAAHIWKFWPERVGLRKKKRKFERTWLEGDVILRSELRDRVIALKKSEILADLNIVDMDKLNHTINQWDNNKMDIGETFTILMTLESFFSQT
jgi:asparagine synthase (glutamine-hydrolysing)